jgi:hypothetical protein
VHGGHDRIGVDRIDIGELLRDLAMPGSFDSISSAPR